MPVSQRQFQKSNYFKIWEEQKNGMNAYKLEINLRSVRWMTSKNRMRKIKGKERMSESERECLALIWLKINISIWSAIKFNILQNDWMYT